MWKWLTAHLIAGIGNVKYPTLLKIVGGLFVLTLLLPDPIPFVDEILLGLVTLMLSRQTHQPNKPKTYEKQPIDVSFKRS